MTVDELWESIGKEIKLNSIITATSYESVDKEEVQN